MADGFDSIKKENYKGSKKRKIPSVTYMADGGEVPSFDDLVADPDPQSAVAGQGFKQLGQMAVQSEPVQNVITGKPLQEYQQALKNKDINYLSNKALGTAMGTLAPETGSMTPITDLQEIHAMRGVPRSSAPIIKAAETVPAENLVQRIQRLKAEENAAWEAANTDKLREKAKLATSRRVSAEELAARTQGRKFADGGEIVEAQDMNEYQDTPGLKPPTDMLGAISQLESSGGKNIKHPTIDYGLQAGQTAIGNYGLLPNTVREAVQSMRNRNVEVPAELGNIHKMSDEEISHTLVHKPKLQRAIAGHMMERIMQRTGNDEDKAAYMWNTGHNLDPNKITPATLNKNPYVQKFRQLKMADGGEVPSFDDLQEDAPHAAPTGSFDDLVDDSEKYSGTGNAIKAGLEGVAQGVAGPLAPLAEQHLLGVSPEDIRGREEAHPIAHGVGEATGLAGSMLTGVGEGALAARAGELAAAHLAERTAAKAAAKAAFETGIIAAGGQTAKLINEDPNTSVQSAIINTGLAAALGGAGGAALGKVNQLWSESAGPKAERFINQFKDRVHARLGGEDVAEGTLYDPFLHKTVERQLGAGHRFADFLFDKAGKAINAQATGAATGEAVGRALGLPAYLGAILGEKALSPLFEEVLPSISGRILNNPTLADGFKASVDYAMAVAKGENLIGKAAKNMFKTNAEIIPAHMMPSQKELDKLDQQVRKAQEDPEHLMNIAPNAQSYLPEHGGAMASLGARASNYLNSLRPSSSPLFPLDPKSKPSPVEMNNYNVALKVAQQPLSVLQDAKDGKLLPLQVQTLNTLYPELQQKITSKLTEEMVSHINKGESVPYKLRMSLSMLMGQPLDSTMSPQAIQSIQALSQPTQNPQQQGAPARGGQAIQKNLSDSATPLQRRQMLRKQ